MYNDLFHPYITGYKAGTISVSMLQMRRLRKGMAHDCDHNELKQGCLLQILFSSLSILPPTMGG